jgi:hypothetical protein
MPSRRRKDLSHKNTKGAIPREEEWNVKCNGRPPFVKANIKERIILDILPSKAYQKRFLESI